ncbi:MAG TPA: glycosyltransferase family 9 protein [Salinivirgaceae bacterium]|nr:glycosyltransferase family 9 protein [Salinivirgaceae bacterium]
MQRVMISRTDGIGDVILTLPVAGLLKEEYLDVEILFLAQNYTRPIVECSTNVDTFISWEDLASASFKERVKILESLNLDAIIHVFPRKELAKAAKKAKIPIRVGTSHRIFHLTTCNKLVNLSRKNSELHESQLNFMLLKPLIDNCFYEIPEIFPKAGFLAPEKQDGVSEYLDKEKINIVLHPKSKGSAREWGLENFKNLIEILDPLKYNIILTGSEQEGKAFRDTLVSSFPHVLDTSGRLSLIQLVSLIAQSDALIACSTGPLHIASILDIYTIGIYPPIRPMHPGRWKPIGNKSIVIVKETECNKCRKSDICSCITDIKPDEIAKILQSLNFN